MGQLFGVPKHTIDIDGERLLDRTVRMIKERCDAKIYIIAFDPTYEVEGTTLFTPVHGPVDFNDTDKFLSSVELWSPDERTNVLYGDVFFSEALMDAIVAYDGDYTFFGRPGRSFMTGNTRHELFCLSFRPDEQSHLREIMLSVQKDLLEGRARLGGGWQVYRKSRGLHWESSEVNESFTAFDDFSEDFDCALDYDRWTTRHKLYGKGARYEKYAPVFINGSKLLFVGQKVAWGAQNLLRQPRQTLQKWTGRARRVTAKSR